MVTLTVRFRLVDLGEISMRAMTRKHCTDASLGIGKRSRGGEYPEIYEARTVKEDGRGTDDLPDEPVSSCTGNAEM